MPGPFGGGLDVQRSILETLRWAAEPVNGTGLHDGIQVGVAAGFATALGAAPEEIASSREAVVKAFDAWANDALYPVPEPTTLLLVLSSIALLAVRRRVNR